MPDDHVADAELLFRAVRDIGENFQWRDGKLLPTSQAFTHISCKASVDRADLCGRDAAYTQRDITDGVLSMVAGEIRGLGFQHEPPKQPIRTYETDVVPDPVEGNPAHAVVVARPDIGTERTLFRKLKARLTWLAATSPNVTWEILPSSQIDV